MTHRSSDVPRYIRGLVLQVCPWDPINQHRLPDDLDHAGLHRLPSFCEWLDGHAIWKPQRSVDELGRGSLTRPQCARRCHRHRRFYHRYASAGRWSTGGKQQGDQSPAGDTADESFCGFGVVLVRCEVSSVEICMFASLNISLCKLGPLQIPVPLRILGRR
jgi:hypothetical protein